METLINYVLPFLFIGFAVLATLYHILTLHDARQDQRATEWARKYRPHQYREVDALTAKDLVRNEWYRLAKTSLIAFIAIFSWTAPPPRADIAALVLWVAVLGVVFLLWFSAYHERRSKASIRARAKKDSTRAYYEY